MAYVTKDMLANLKAAYELIGEAITAIEQGQTSKPMQFNNAKPSQKLKPGMTYKAVISSYMRKYPHSTTPQIIKDNPTINPGTIRSIAARVRKASRHRII